MPIKPCSKISEQQRFVVALCCGYGVYSSSNPGAVECDSKDNAF